MRERGNMGMKEVEEESRGLLSKSYCELNTLK